MKRILGVLLAVVMMMGVCLPCIKAQAKDPTDKILSFDIEITTREDASLDMVYTIKWKVLESEKAGPLTWVKIGLPNKHVDELTALSDNIDEIKLSTSGGVYANIYFEDEYEEGDVVEFSFSFHQDYMYKQSGDGEEAIFEFTPGWFDEMDVNVLMIWWYGEEAEEVSPEVEYFIFSAYVWMFNMLDPSEKVTVSLTYPWEGVYEFDEEKLEHIEAGTVIGLIMIFGLGLCRIPRGLEKRFW